MTDAGRPVVLIADKLAPSTVEALGGDVEVRWVDGPDRPKLLEAVVDADAILVRSATTVDAEVLDAGTKLKIIARAGVGLDNVDVPAATERGVMVVNAPTSNIHSAAEHAIALLMSTARQVPAADATLREHTWKRSSFSGVEIFDKTVGVVGLGRIGQLVAARLAAFEAKIIAYDPYVSAARAAQLGIELVPLDELLERAQLITIHLPKTKETAGLIGADGRVLLGAVVPFGRLTSEQARYLAAIGAAVTITPEREILVGDLDEPVAETVVRVLAPLGFIFDARSPWTALTACTGSPGCAKSASDVRTDVRRRVAGLDPDADAPAPEHWVGCDRGCGSPSRTHVRVLASSAGYVRTERSAVAPRARRGSGTS